MESVDELEWGYTSCENLDMKFLNRLTLDICYARDICGLIGVDYVNLPRRDITKIRRLASLLLEKDSNYILPLLY